MARSPLLSRRATLLGLTAAATLGKVSLALAAAPTEQRFVVVILRGALDGMAAVVPYGDRDLVGLRGGLVDEVHHECGHQACEHRDKRIGRKLSKPGLDKPAGRLE